MSTHTLKKDGWALTLEVSEENAIGSVSDPDGCKTVLRDVLSLGETIGADGRTRKVPQAVQLWLEELFTEGWSPKRIREFVARGCRPPAKVQSTLQTG